MKSIKILVKTENKKQNTAYEKIPYSLPIYSQNLVKKTLSETIKTYNYWFKTFLKALVEEVNQIKGRGELREKREKNNNREQPHLLKLNED